MRLHQYLEESEMGFVSPDLFNPLLCLYEAVIYVNSQSYIDVLYHPDVEMEIQNCNNNNEFIYLLNKIYKTRDIQFIVKNNSKMGGITTKDGTIKIFVNRNFLLLYNTKFNGFINKLKTVFDHELIHREQSKRIDWSRYQFNKPNTKSQYLSNKQELMAYAKTIINQLLLKYYSEKGVLSFLQSPTVGINNYLDMYLGSFDRDSKTIKRLYKYMYEYLVTGK